MSGYNLIKKIDELRETADKFGFVLCHPEHYWGSDVDLVAIKPKDRDSLPIYSRDANIYTGNINDIINFFQGVQWARNYDEIMKVSDTKKRERKEQDMRNANLVRILKEEKIVKEDV